MERRRPAERCRMVQPDGFWPREVYLSALKSSRRVLFDGRRTRLPPVRHLVPAAGAGVGSARLLTVLVLFVRAALNLFELRPKQGNDTTGGDRLHVVQVIEPGDGTAYYRAPGCGEVRSGHRRGSCHARRAGDATPPKNSATSLWIACSASGSAIRRDQLDSGTGKHHLDRSRGGSDHHLRPVRGSHVPPHLVIGLAGHVLPGLSQAARERGCTRS